MTMLSVDAPVTALDLCCPLGATEALVCLPGALYMGCDTCVFSYGKMVFLPLTQMCNYDFALVFLTL